MMNLAPAPKLPWCRIEEANCVAGETEAAFVESIRRHAREVHTHYVEGNSAAYGLGWRLYEVWIGLRESDSTWDKAEAYQRVVGWIAGLGLDPETTFIPNAAQLQHMIERIHQNEDCDLGVLF
jgi:hypothetical protein